LPDSQRQVIRAKYESLFVGIDLKDDWLLPSERPDGTPIDPSYYGFDQVLERLSSSFEDWRYLYEKTSYLNFSCQFHLAISMQTAIINLRPDWKNIIDGIGEPPILIDPENPVQTEKILAYLRNFR